MENVPQPVEALAERVYKAEAALDLLFEPYAQGQASRLGFRQRYDALAARCEQPRNSLSDREEALNAWRSIRLSEDDALKRAEAVSEPLEGRRQ